MKLQGFLFCITPYCRCPHHPGSFIPIILEGNNYIRHSSNDKYDFWLLLLPTHFSNTYTDKNRTMVRSHRFIDHITRNDRIAGTICYISQHIVDA